MALAIFDLDNTLIAGDSDHSWGEFMVAEGMVDPASYKQANDQFYTDYERGELDLDAYLKFSLQPLTEYSLEELDHLHKKFMSEFIAPMKLQQAEELLGKHKAAGDYLLIITSTNGFITNPIARDLGVDHILATDPEIIAGRYTGNIVGTPCFQGGKIARLNSWLQQSSQYGYHGDLQGAWFYSDSINDLPLLQYVDNPVVVDPDDALRHQAAEQQWPIISLRD